MRQLRSTKTSRSVTKKTKFAFVRVVSWITPSIEPKDESGPTATLPIIFPVSSVVKLLLLKMETI